MICDLDAYRELTGDHTSSDEAVEAALARAQKRVQDGTERFWELATYTETLAIRHNSGCSYPDLGLGSYSSFVMPSAYPVTAVSDPAGAAFDGAFVDASALAWLQIGGLPHTATITYTGGLAADDIPEEIVEVTAEIALRVRFPASTVGVPAGANSVTVGGQTYSGPRLGGLSTLPPSIRATLTKHKHIKARLP